MADEPDQAAADYVLGLLPPDERRAFLGRLAREPALVAEVAEWQQRLVPLALALEPVAPSAALWSRIERSIGPVAANDRAAPAGWRWAAIAASLVAVAMSGVVLQRGIAPVPVPAPTQIAQAPRPSQPTMLAALSTGGETPGLFIRYDRVTDRVTVIPIGLTADEAHSLELWVIAGKAPPKPMGLIDPKKRMQQRAASGMIVGPVVFAVSREPLGGSPTGKPTGPIMMTGQLMAMPEA